MKTIHYALAQYHFWRVICGGYWLKSTAAWYDTDSRTYHYQEIAPDPRIIGMEDNNEDAVILRVVGLAIVVIMLVTLAFIVGGGV